MPLPEWKKKVPGKQSIRQRAAANILNHDLVRPLGGVGTTTGATGLVDPGKPLGNDPRADQWNGNPLVVTESTAPAARPPRSRSKSDLVR